MIAGLVERRSWAHCRRMREPALRKRHDRAVVIVSRSRQRFSHFIENLHWSHLANPGDTAMVSHIQRAQLSLQILVRGELLLGVSAVIAMTWTRE